jgi:hypothetical protein
MNKLRSTPDSPIPESATVQLNADEIEMILIALEHFVHPR